MIINEIKGDLFKAPKEYYLAHCISGDFALGSGIAKKFKKIYNMRNKLFQKYPLEKRKKYGYVGKALLVDNVFNLVTKARGYQKPTYDSLKETLIDMREQCKEIKITKLAIPRIGSGHDKLDWDSVKDVIIEVFSDAEIEILVYVL